MRRRQTSRHRLGIESDRNWQCGICTPPSPELVNAKLVVRRNGSTWAPAAELSDGETGRLAELEAVVERGLQTFVEVGEALGEIRDQRLYRATHRTFEEYCRDRWGFVASRARQLIAAAETVTAVTLDGSGTGKRGAGARARSAALPAR